MNGRDVHTEHCCAKNGCKYGVTKPHPIPVISDAG